MIDPFTYWSRVMAGWRTVGETMAGMATIGTNAQAVINARGTTIGEALRSPMTADVAELSRMAPEKVAAFSLAGSAIANAWVRMQADCIAEAQHAAVVMTRPRPMTMSELADMSSRSAALGLRLFEAGTRASRDALTPIGRATSANARRLQKRNRPRKAA